ncbi:MAG: DNA polymerase III subunit chi [Zoogloeaceae bacterium]|jgi:DNA polymerase-3 subunit chi|nr:DNA polymerase III subunit chi [Zoogloeaceae bacterium]
MTRVFVYYRLPNRLDAACGLVARACAQGKDFIIYTPDPERAQLIDRLLWTQAPLGFIPHCRADAPLAAETPVLIAGGAEHLETLPPTCSRARLLNLDDGIPPGFERYENLIELVEENAADRQRARERTRRYQAMGCEIRYTDMATKH